jgi:GNAT superfamily N-acetyltransferase
VTSARGSPRTSARTRITTALATLDGEPAGTGYAIRTDGRGGPALYLAGVAVAPHARRRGVGAALSSWLVERGLASGASSSTSTPTPTTPPASTPAWASSARPGLDVYVDL